MADSRESFGSRKATVIALAGTAIGLGNIWRFPYMAGEYGGAAFILVYIVATVLFSLPVFVSDIVIGRRSGLSAYGAMDSLSGGHRRWQVSGFLSVFIPLFILSYYSVIGGWSLYYLFKSCTLSFVVDDPETVIGIFGQFSSGTLWPVIAHVLFIGACCLVVAGGVKAGIEKFSKLTIPVLFVLIVIIAIYSISLPGAGEGVKYLIKPDFSQLTPKTFTYALGQSFYSLSLGMGIIITYGSYVSKQQDIMFISGWTAFFDLIFAVLAGFVIMPAVFAAGIEPGAGPSLIFQSIPYIFATMAQGAPVLSSIMAILFFVSIIIAAMTSGISLVEVGVAYLCDRYHMRRPLASLIIFLLCGSVGVVLALSFGPLADWKILGKGLFDFFDWFSSNILLLVAAFLSVYFAGHVMKRSQVRDELTNGGMLKGNSKAFGTVYFLIKWVAPIGVLLIFITNFIL